MLKKNICMHCCEINYNNYPESEVFSYEDFENFWVLNRVSCPMKFMGEVLKEAKQNKDGNSMINNDEIPYWCPSVGFHD